MIIKTNSPAFATGNPRRTGSLACRTNDAGCAGGTHPAGQRFLKLGVYIRGWMSAVPDREAHQRTVVFDDIAAGRSSDEFINELATLENQINADSIRSRRRRRCGTVNPMHYLFQPV